MKRLSPLSTSPTTPSTPALERAFLPRIAIHRGGRGTENLVTVETPRVLGPLTEGLQACGDVRVVEVDVEKFGRTIAAVLLQEADFVSLFSKMDLVTTHVAGDFPLFEHVEEGRVGVSIWCVRE